MKKSKSSLINKSAVRKYVLQRIAEDRPHLGFTRVSESLLLLLEVKVQEMLNRAIHQHRSTGKTFTDLDLG